MRRKSSPKIEGLIGLAGPTVEDDIRRLIQRYGARAVKEAADRHAKAKIGRPKTRADWSDLLPFIEEDVQIWLQGGDPFEARTNYAIAKAYADQRAAHLHPANLKRVQRKLKAEPHGRRWLVLAMAWERSGDEHPYAMHLRTLEALDDLESSIWGPVLKWANGFLADYVRLHGKPDKNLSMRQIEDGTRPSGAIKDGLLTLPLKLPSASD